MTPIDFLKIYDPFKLSYINSVRIINNIENDTFIKVLLNGNIKLNTPFNIWTQEYFLYQINNIGMMFAEITIHEANKNAFESLDEFMYYTRFRDNDNLEKDLFLKYPFKKENILSKDDFKTNLHLYCDEIFMNNEKDYLIDLKYEHYIEGYFYFNEPSVIVLGSAFLEKYIAFHYNPYI